MAALRQAITDGWADVAGGTYSEAEDALLPLESILWQFARGGDVYRAHLDERSVETFARRRFGLFVQLPQIAKRFGIRYALHMSFDAGRFPLRPETKRLWEGPDGSSLESLLRPPLAADRRRRAGGSPGGWRPRCGTITSPRCPLVHWPSPVAPWYHRPPTGGHLLSRPGPMDHAQRLLPPDRPPLRDASAPSRTPMPRRTWPRPSRGAIASPISWLPRHRRLRARLDAARTIRGAGPRDRLGGRGEASDTGSGFPADLLRRGRSRSISSSAGPTTRAGSWTGSSRRGRQPWRGSSSVPARRRGGTRRRGYLVINPAGLAPTRRGPPARCRPRPAARGSAAGRAVHRRGRLRRRRPAAVRLRVGPRGDRSRQRRPPPRAGLSARDRELRNESMADRGRRDDRRTPEHRGRRRAVAATGAATGPPRAGRRVRQADQLRRCVATGSTSITAAPPWCRRPPRGASSTLARGIALASFEQRYRLWTGRPILEIRRSP